MTYIYTSEQSSCFYDWLQSSGDYKNNHSYDGARAIFEYYEGLAEGLGQPIEFDPIAWCCDWSEYESIEDKNFINDYDNLSLDDLNDRTIVISEQPLVFQAF
jgi:hypothetical protein